MAINIRSTVLVDADSDPHYNDLAPNQILAKVQFPSGVHEVISDPTSNTNPTREFYQLSILTAGGADSGFLTINTPTTVVNGVTVAGTVIAAGIALPANASVEQIATAVRNGIDAQHGSDLDMPRFVGIDLSFNIINFSTERRGNPNIHIVTGIPDIGSFIQTDADTGIRWRIDIISAASNSGQNTEIILDAGIWTGVA